MPFTHLKRGYSWQPPQEKPLLATQVTRVCLPPCSEAPGGRTELSIFAHKSFSLLTPSVDTWAGAGPPFRGRSCPGQGCRVGACSTRASTSA